MGTDSALEEDEHISLEQTWAGAVLMQVPQLETLVSTSLQPVNTSTDPESMTEAVQGLVSSRAAVDLDSQTAGSWLEV